MELPKVASLIKTIYFYLVSFVTLMILIVNSAMLINLGLKTFIFTEADNYRYMPSPVCYAPVAKDGAEPAKLSAEDCAKQNEDNAKNEKNNRKADRQRETAENISFILVSLPLFAIHWRSARKRGE